MSPKPRLPSPASEILGYLSRHPHAQDTIDGITRWWIVEECVRKWSPKVAGAVAALVEHGFLEKKESPDGRILYQLSANYRRSLRSEVKRHDDAD